MYRPPRIRNNYRSTLRQHAAQKRAVKDNRKTTNQTTLPIGIIIIRQLN